MLSFLLKKNKIPNFLLDAGWGGGSQLVNNPGKFNFRKGDRNLIYNRGDAYCFLSSISPCSPSPVSQYPFIVSPSTSRVIQIV
jgi:hypothetical protein